MKILVTGGAGFIGSHVAEHALQAGHEVAALDNLSSGKVENIPPGVGLYEADVRDAGGVDRAFRDFKPDLVSHQAAQASVALSVREPVLDAEINLIGTLNVLNACVAAGVQRLVFAGSGGTVYGTIPDGQSASPASATDPLCPYGCSKLAAESYLKTYRLRHGLDYRILRYANVYGPRQDAHGEAGVVAIFLERLLRGQPIQINARRTPGDEGCVRDYVYVADVARANLASLEATLDASVINVCTGVPTSTLEIARTLARILDVQAEMLFRPMRPGDLEYAVLDADEFRACLGAPTPLEQGLAETAAWCRARRVEGGG